MAQVTGKNLLEQILQNLDLEMNDFVKNFYIERLQDRIDNQEDDDTTLSSDLLTNSDVRSKLTEQGATSKAEQVLAMREDVNTSKQEVEADTSLLTLTEALGMDTMPEVYDIQMPIERDAGETDIAGATDAIDAAKALTAEEQTIVDGAGNAANVEYDVSYTINDTLANIQDDTNGIVDGADNYTIADGVKDAGEVTVEGAQLTCGEVQAIIDGATNNPGIADILAFNIQDTAANVINAIDLPAVTTATQVTVSDAQLTAAQWQQLDALGNFVLGETTTVIPETSVTAEADTYKNGDTMTFTVSEISPNAAGKEVTYTLTGVEAGDIVGGRLTNTVTLDENGEATVDVTLLATAANAGKTVGFDVSDQDDATDFGAASVSVQAAATPTENTVTLNDILGANDEYLLYEAGDTTPALYTVESNGSIDGADGKISVAGSANVTVEAGSGDDTIAVNGTGNNVVNAGSGENTILLSKANNVVIIDDGDFVANSAIYGDADGVNTIVVSGDNDLTTALALENVQNLVLESDADVTIDEDQLAQMTSLVANGANSAKLTINDGAGTETIDLTDAYTGTLSKLTLDANVSIALTADQINDINTIVMNNGEIVTDQAGAEALAAKGITPSIDAGDALTLKEATTQDIAAETYVSYDVNVDSEEAFDQLYLNGKSAEQLVDAGNTTATIHVSGTATVKEAMAIKSGTGVSGNAADTIGTPYAVADTAKNIADSLDQEVQTFTVTAAAAAGTLTVAGVDIAIAGDTTDDNADKVGAKIVAEKDSILAQDSNIENITFDNATDKVTVTYKQSAGNVADIVVDDDNANTGITASAITTVTEGNNGWLNAAEISSLAITDAATVAQAETIFADNGSLDAAVDAAALDDEDDQVITKPAYSIEDDADAIETAADNASTILSGAESVSLNDGETFSVAEAATVTSFLGSKLTGYDLADNADNLAGASTSVRNGATDITANTAATVIEATKIAGFNNTGTTTYSIKDTAAKLYTAQTAVLDGAIANDGTVKFENGITEEVSVVQATKLLPYLAEGIDFVLKDTAANLTGTNGLAVIAALDNIDVEVDGTITLEQAQTLATAQADGTSVTYENDPAMEDSADNLLAALNDKEFDALGNDTVGADGTDGDQTQDAVDAEAIVDAMDTVTATGGMTVEQANTLLNTNIGPEELTYDLADEASIIATGGNKTLVEGANAVSITDTATLTEAGTIYGIRQDVEMNVEATADEVDTMITAEAGGEVQELTLTGGPDSSVNFTLAGVTTSLTKGDTAEEAASDIAGSNYSGVAEIKSVEADGDKVVITYNLTAGDVEDTVVDAGTTGVTFDPVTTTVDNFFHSDAITSMTMAAGETADVNTQAQAIVTANDLLSAAGKDTMDYAISDSYANLEALDATAPGDVTDNKTVVDMLNDATNVEMVDTAENIEKLAADAGNAGADANEDVFALIDTYAIEVGSDSDGSALSTDMTAQPTYYDGATSITISTANLTVAEAKADYDLLVTDENADKLAFTSIQDSASNLEHASSDTDLTTVVGKADAVDVDSGMLQSFVVAVSARTFSTNAGDEIVFDGATIDISGASSEGATATLLADATYDNWTAEASGANVTFTAKVPGATSDPLKSDFTLTDSSSDSDFDISLGSNTYANPTVAQLDSANAIVEGDLSVSVTLEDSVANLLTAESLFGSLAAGTDSEYIKATDAATVSEYETLIDMAEAADIDVDTLAEMNVDIQDSITGVQAATADLLGTLGDNLDDDGSEVNQISLKAGTQVALTIEQAEALDANETWTDSTIANILDADGDPVTYEIVDSIDNIINASTPGDILTNASSIIATGNAVIPEDDEYTDNNNNAGDTYINLLEALVIQDNFDTENSEYSVSGLASTLVGTAGNDALKSAQAATVTDSITLDDAATVYGNNNNVTFTEIGDAYTDLFNIDAETNVATFDTETVTAEVEAIVGNADQLTLTGAMTVDEASAVTTLLGAQAVTYELTDTAANLAGAGELLANATAITVDNGSDAKATVAEITAIREGVDTDNITLANIVYDLEDTATALAAAEDILFTDVAASITQVEGDTATMAEAKAIEDKPGTIALTVADNATNVVADIADAVANGLNVAGEDTVTLTSTATLSQAATLDTYDNNIDTAADVAGTDDIDEGAIYIADTYANLVDPDNVAGYSDAAAVTVTDTINVSKAVQIFDQWDDNDDVASTADYAQMTYDIEDAQAYMIKAFDEDNAVLGNANSITVTDVGTIEVAELADGGTYYITGSVAQIGALPQELLEVGYIVNDTVANIAAADASIMESDFIQGSVVTDTAANIQAADLTITGVAAEVHVEDTIDVAVLDAMQTLGLNLFSIAGVEDDAANLAAASLDAGTQDINTITVTDASITDAQVDEIVAAGADDDGANMVYTLEDEHDNLTNATIVENAASVIITDEIKVTEADAMYQNNTNITMSIVDTEAALDVLVETDISEAEQKQIDAINAADSVSLAANQTVEVDVATALVGLGDAFDGIYTLSQDATALAEAQTSILEDAQEVQVTGTATVAEAAVLSVLANIKTTTLDGVDYADITITDTAENLAAASADLLDNVAQVNVSTGNGGDDKIVTAEQATALQALIDNDAINWSTTNYTVEDEYANITNAAYADGVKNAQNLNVLDGVTVVEAGNVNTAASAAGGQTTTVTYGLEDTATLLQTTTPTAVKNNTTSVTVTDTTVSAEQAGYINTAFETQLESVTGDNYTTLISFNEVTGTLEDLTATITDESVERALHEQATTVNLDGSTVTVSELMFDMDSDDKYDGGFLKAAGDKLVGDYDILDSVDNIVNARLNDTYSASIVAGATTVAVDSTTPMTIASSEVVIVDGQFTGDYDISDTAAEIDGAEASLINGAQTVTVDMVADTKETLDLSGYSPTDLVVDLTTADSSGTYTENSGVYSLTDVDTLTLSDAATKADAQELDLDGSGYSAFVQGFIGLDEFTATDTTSALLVTYDGSANAVVINNPGNFKVEDTYYLNGTSGNDTIDASDADGGFGLVSGDKSYIYAGKGNDDITGSAGADIIIGGAGADTIDGGAGADIIKYTSSSDGASLVTTTDVTAADDDFTATAGTTTDDVTFVKADDTIQIDGALKSSLEASGATDISSSTADLDYDAIGIFMIDSAQAKLAGDDFGDISALTTAFNTGTGTVTNNAAGDEILFTVENDSGDATGLYYFKDVDGDGDMSDGDQVALLGIVGDAALTATDVVVA